ncbi:MAG: FAD-dependent oxidoreductase [Solirubrobacteraceae bacterium]|nr:FAD-dependent oxidoreductase [Solirubrobacteraceae bacterium]
MADRHVGVLIVGGGPAGATCAETLRERGYEGEILLVGREPDPPYERPPGSKEFLAGKSAKEDAFLHPVAWYAEQNIELLVRTSVMKFDAEAKEASLSTKQTVSFDHAVLATGANVRRLPVDGSDLEGIHYLRALRNADAIRDDASEAANVVLVGGSYIGCEVASTLTALGKQCTVVMQEELPLSRGFGDTAGRFFQALLESKGIRFVGGAEVDRFDGEGQSVEQVVLKDGTVLDADVVVLGVGAVPDVMVARGAKLELGPGGGVLCDDRLRTSAPDVYAAGDMCEYESAIHGRHVRIEHFEVAIAHGKTVAANILGDDVAHTEVPYFWSDLSDWATLESVGPALDGFDSEVVRGSLDDGEFTLWLLREGTLAAALTVGRGGDLEHARRFLTEHTPLGEHHAALADVDADLSAI